MSHFYQQDLEKIRESQEAQKTVLDQQKLILEQQRVLLEKRQADLTFRLDLSEHVVQYVSDIERAPVLIALVKTLPKTEYTTALLQVLYGSDIDRVREGAETTLRQRTELIYKPSTFQSSSADTAHLPSITVYLCEERSSARDAIDLVNRVGDKLASAGLADSVKGGIWGGDPFDREIPVNSRSGRTLIIYDKEPDESWEASQIESTLDDLDGLPPMDVIPNEPDARITEWSLSVLVCPAES